VPQLRYPLRINVGFLRHQSIGHSRDILFDVPLIQVEPDEDILDLKGKARLSRTPQGLLLEGEFSGKMRADCVRCLAEFLQPLKTSFSELYAFDKKSVTESELIIPDDANIDLGPLVREYLLIEMPINPLCRPDCKGLCPICGEDLNLTTCEHVSQTN
jgi:uncharacterized protein